MNEQTNKIKGTKPNVLPCIFFFGGYISIFSYVFIVCGIFCMGSRSDWNTPENISLIITNTLCLVVLLTGYIIGNHIWVTKVISPQMVKIVESMLTVCVLCMITMMACYFLHLIF